MSSDLPKLVIEGITVEGAVFRPSDWIERLIGTLSTYGDDRRASPRPYSGMDRRHRQANFLKAQIIEGRKCLVVDTRLRDANPVAYRFLLEFIQNNRLRMQETDSASPASAESP
jgi:hypothetical protein